MKTQVIQTQVGGVMLHGRLGVDRAAVLLGGITAHMIKSRMDTCTIPAQENEGVMVYLRRDTQLKVIGNVVGHEFAGSVCGPEGKDMPVSFFVPIRSEGDTNFEKPWVTKGDGDFIHLTEFQSETKSGAL